MNEISTGLIGFFDILGYQSLLENNEPEEIIETVLGSIENSYPYAKQVVISLINRPNGLSTENTEMVINKLREIKPLVFSDTILLSIPLSNDATDLELYWILFLALCIALTGKMFEAGLPLRGAISFGKYCIRDFIFVGKPIAEAHKLGSTINLSATVLDPKAINQLKASSI